MSSLQWLPNQKIDLVDVSSKFVCDVLALSLILSLPIFDKLFQ